MTNESDVIIYITREEATKRRLMITDFDLTAGIYKIDDQKAAEQNLKFAREEKRLRREARQSLVKNIS